MCLVSPNPLLKPCLAQRRWPLRLQWDVEALVAVRNLNMKFEIENRFNGNLEPVEHLVLLSMVFVWHCLESRRWRTHK
jgi:hypothetical protein